MTHLPVYQVLPQLKDALSERSAAVLIAEPGAGKTTTVPLALLEEPWLSGQKIIMLEPRKLAARSAATYMAASLGEHVGECVGYRVRMESRVGARTRIEVVTEGVLTRMLQHDPELHGVGLIIFDEYHERSLHADTGLAFALEAQAALREDLRLLIMSATLEAEPIAELLGGVPVIVSEGRTYPVSTIYVPTNGVEELPKRTSRVIQRALSEQEGDLLVFLPGAREIRRTAQELLRAGLDSNMMIRELYSALPAQQQDLAIGPDASGRRKIVLSTSIAESSITIRGITTVIDAGYSRTEIYSPKSGLPQLVTRRVSKASADQRRGRAGRVTAGVCYRMWSEEEHGHLLSRNIPEIMESDLTSLALELAAWGVGDPNQLSWLDAPPDYAFRQGQELLTQLQALDEKLHITPHGRQMAALGMHPRLAHMLLLAQKMNQGSIATRIAALLQGRDILRGPSHWRDQDLRSRLDMLCTYERQGKSAEFDSGLESNLTSLLQETKKMQRQLGLPDQEHVLEAEHPYTDIGGLLSFAYPDRIAKNRGDGSFIMRSGRGAKLPVPQTLSRAAYMVIANVEDTGADSTIQLAAELELAWIQRHFKHDITLVSDVSWDREAGRVRAKRRQLLGGIVINEQNEPAPAKEQVAEAVLDGIRQEGLGLLNWSKSADQLRARLAFMFLHDSSGDWPNVSEESLLEQADTWLLPYLDGVSSRQASIGWPRANYLSIC